MTRLLRLLFIACAALGMESLCSAQSVTYSASMNGPSESPANSSPGIGITVVTFDPAAHFLSVDVTFSGLTGTTTASHIHAPTTTPFTGTAAVATQVPTFTGFPLGVTSGFYSSTFDTSLAASWNPTYITNNGGTTAGAEAAFATALAQGRAYLNIHTSTFPGGEIRGFLTVIPEPSSMLLLGAAGFGVAALLRRRRERRQTAARRG